MQETPSPLYCSLAQLLQLRYYANTLPPNLQRQFSPMPGQQRVKKRGSKGMEFHQARPYVNGDDVRTIDWRISARKGKTHTREFHQDHERPQMLLLDMQAHMCFASVGCLKSVQAAQYTAWLGWRYLKHHNRVGALLHTSQAIALRPTLNAKRYSYWLHQLAQATQRLVQTQQHNTSTPVANWRHSIQQALRLITPGSQLQLIGDLTSLNEDAWQLLKHVARHYTIEAVHVQDPLETNLPVNRKLSVSDGNNSFKLKSPLLAQQMQQRQQQLGQQFYEIGASLSVLSTATRLFK